MVLGGGDVLFLVQDGLSATLFAITALILVWSAASALGITPRKRTKGTDAAAIESYDE